MVQAGHRAASHANSWYTGSAKKLTEELDENLAEVPAAIDGVVLPVQGARVIIAPHAGYSYSGPCAAWAYKCLDLSKAKRTFVLGPSHTYYLAGCALTTFAYYDTPLGALRVDEATVEELRATGRFVDMPARNDTDEHSLEMHLPYLVKRLQQTLGRDGDGDGDATTTTTDYFPPIVPILVGDNDAAEEKAFGALLAPYLADPANVFIVSSDFCHWGTRFNYTQYMPEGRVMDLFALAKGVGRGKAARRPDKPPLHESIKMLDQMAMDAIATGSHKEFRDNIRLTRNTVCGRHPIGVVMAALEIVDREAGRQEGEGAGAGADAGAGAGEERPRFKFVQYDRSSLAEDLDDSSVSYASAYAVV